MNSQVETMDASFDPVEYINRPRWQASRYGLERMRELLNLLGRPQDELKFVHVAGTNGKGSICTYLSNVMQAAGYKTGMFTSPYIEVFEERIQVDGENIPWADLQRITWAVREHAEAMEDHPTEFELMCAVAMCYFAECECDIVIAEVGLGGRLDATNIIPSPEVCAIARMGLDHTQLLGDTLAEVAREKAGIIKSGATVVSWPQVPEAREVFQSVADELGCPIIFADPDELTVEPLRLTVDTQAMGDPLRTIRRAGDHELPRRAFSYRGFKDLRTALLASYQPANATVALEAILALRERGWDIPDEAVACGISQARWPGRFEVVTLDPLMVVDGGHNPQGAEVMAETLGELLPDAHPIFIMGVLADKDYPSMLDVVVPCSGGFVTVTPSNPRRLLAEDLAAEIRTRIAEDEDKPVEVAESFEDAVRRALVLAGPGGVVCAFGSLYSVAKVKKAVFDILAAVE